MDTSEVPVHDHQDQTMAEPALPLPSIVPEHNEPSALANGGIKDPMAAPAMDLPPTAAAPLEPLKPNGVASHAADPASAPQHAPAESAPQPQGDVPAPSSLPTISALINESNKTPDSTPNAALSTPPVESAVPMVQQPVSDVRSLAEPTSEERASEIREAKEQSDLASDRELATSLAASNDAPIERTISPAPQPQPIETSAEAMVTAQPEASREEASADLPHRTPPHAAPISQLLEPTHNEPASTPALPVPQPDTSAKPGLAAQEHQAIDQDWEMVDAPSPAKVTRPREDEDEAEPATKRHKAEEISPPPDEPMAEATPEAPSAKHSAAEAPTADVHMDDKASVGDKAPAEDKAQATEPAGDDTAMQVDTSPMPVEVPSASAAATANATVPAAIAPYVPKAGNAEWDKPITTPQKKALQKIISNLKRGQHATAFKEPVDWKALNIPTYPTIISKPMDLRTMETKVKENKYQTVNEFVSDFDQIIINTETFNGLYHDVTRHGHDLGKSFEKQMSQIPSTEFIEPPLPDKKGKRRDSTEVQRARRRESRTSLGGAAAEGPATASTSGAGAAATAKSPTAASPASPAFALKESGLPQIRRGSETNPDGRPRREIHPPAPKDLPYSAQKPRKKKYAAELRFCQKILNDLFHPRNAACNWPFTAPVDPVAMNLPTYRKIVKHPMDMSTMQTRLKENYYDQASQFEADMRLMFKNCFKFNVAGDLVYKAGEQCERIFNDLWEEKREWLKKNAPKSGGGSPASDSDDSDAEEDDQDAEADDEGDEEQARINELEAQIQAMSRHLEEMRKSGEVGPKKKQRTKSTSKAASKEKGGTSKKKAAAKSEKKATKPKKKDNYVTYEQKQDISERINTLPPAQMNQALKVIRDNMPTLQGAQEDEIELDIDELSDEVLHKLLMFVRKYAPKPEDPVEAKAAPKPAASTKPKKNKPMGKVEQEARIKELREKLAGGASAMAAGSAEDESASGGRIVGTVESSGDEDDDSEESEED